MKITDAVNELLTRKTIIASLKTLAWDNKWY